MVWIARFAFGFEALVLVVEAKWETTNLRANNNLNSFLAGPLRAGNETEVASFGGTLCDLGFKRKRKARQICEGLF